MNPRAAKNRAILDRDAAITAHLSVLVSRVIGMTRAVRDNTAPDLASDLVIGRITTELARIGSAVRVLAARQGGRDVPSAALPDTSPGREGGAAAALSAPIEVIRPNSRHWILVGALLEDIRRVREELLGEQD
jgi:hypothetical protein